MMEQYIKRTTNSRGIRLFVGALLLTVSLLLSTILVPATSHAKAMAKEIEVLAPEDTLGTTGPAQAEDEGSAAEHESIGTSSPIETPEDNPDIPNNHIEGMYLHAIDLGNTSCGDAVIVASEHDILLMDLGNQSTFERIREALDELGAPRHNTYSNTTLPQLSS